ncbi:putative ABC transporter ATP-binding protein [Actinoplanes missouriensis 431]|uniref:Putative ABC transporter ATP-binding protein n=1 Tax=Actinoplanes missouriensis (strain ATCC 14538 / DSM 43046 / CBS 188.64 / JCM 3121 / NBRC 102363 / NCIMB 12654 / NRRL B-3342 / UNCC 431) TaxID=512565 RepID=I0H5M8_ACTM4|nr:ABC transporter ATP-binding protein [Actinoplanes missouriensis]BAL88315.1 putative ABC transporter ATP-binding protein [Actinoplanes missouriensis 431]
MILLDQVSRTFPARTGAVTALHEIDLAVAEGEFVAVIGRSGCGKSTLLRLIAGLLEPTSGTITVAGRPVRAPSREVALMQQQPALLPWRTALGNVLLPVEMARLPRADGTARARELLTAVGLADFEHRHPYELSGGMQQRVALCRALIQQPRVLLMDEPFSALDALTREDMAAQLQALHLARPATTVFVTHSIQEAVLLADRVVVLTPRPGRVRKVLDVEIARPRSLGHSAALPEVAECVAQLHDLLASAGEHGSC